MKKGGSVKSSASKRADGCAKRGKTKVQDGLTNKGK
jgi:hypothetical protein